jgi:hypothetical protein
MSGIGVGARVRDISGHSELLGLSEPGQGVIVSPPEGWTVHWDNPLIGSLNWSNEQLELVTPDASSQAEIERLRKALEPFANGSLDDFGSSIFPTIDAETARANARAALSGSKA